MAAEKALAIVLRTTDFSETSVIATLFSREFGKLRGLAKGGRRPKGPFESALDLLSFCRVVFLPKSSDALDLLTEAKLERRFRPVVGDLPTLYAGYLVIELLEQLTDDKDPLPELFDAAELVLLSLHARRVDLALTAWWMHHALRIAGHGPSLDACVECGRTVEPGRRAAFGLQAGGVLCEDCRGGKRQVVQLGAGARVGWRGVAHAAAPGDVALDATAGGELTAVMGSYVQHVLGRRLVMPAMLSGMLRGAPRRQASPPPDATAATN